jgi:hypothetical protein
MDKVIEGASNTFRARLSLPNANNALPAGLRCKADLSPQEPAGGQPMKHERPGAADVKLQVRPAMPKQPSL